MPRGLLGRQGGAAAHDAKMAAMRWLYLALVVASCARTDKPDPLELYTNGATANERLPLIVALHGYGGSPEDVPRVLHDLSVRARAARAARPVPRRRRMGMVRPLARRCARRARARHHARRRRHRKTDRRRSAYASDLWRPHRHRIFAGWFSQLRARRAHACARERGLPAERLLATRFTPEDQARRCAAHHGVPRRGRQDRERVARSRNAGGAGRRGVRDAAACSLYPGVGHAQVPGPVATPDVRAAIVGAIRDAGCAH